MSLSPTDVNELAVTYAALILHDDNAPITADKINTIVKAAGLTVPPFWANLYANVLGKHKIDDLIMNAGGSGAPAPAPVAAPVAAPSGKDSGKKEEPKESKKKEEKKVSEEEEIGAFGLFDE